MQRSWILLLVLGCGRAASPVPPPALDGAALRPATLVYDGHHDGDHPTWAYRAVVTIAAAERAGREVWRRTSHHGDDARVVATLEVDRRTLALVHSELKWNDATMSVDHTPGRTTGVVEVAGKQRAVEHTHREPAVLYDALDLWLAAQPLAVGFEARISVLEFWLIREPVRYATRPFTVRVAREEAVRVPAGEIPALVVTLEPGDGDARLRSTYHLRKTPPHYPVRMEYVVNPATVGDEKRSTGIDELVSITP